MNLNHKSPNVSSGNLFDFLGEDDDVVMSEFIQEEENVSENSIESHRCVIRSKRLR